jgi:hypothetical protein
MAEREFFYVSFLTPLHLSAKILTATKLFEILRNAAGASLSLSSF